MIFYSRDRFASIIFPLQEGVSCQDLLCDLYDDLIRRLMDSSAVENIFVSQPCRDNTLYLLSLVDEMLISEIDHKLPVYSKPEILFLFSSLVICC